MNETIETQLQRHQLQLASLRKRAAAFILDEFIVSTLFLIVMWDTVFQAKTMEAFLFITNAYALEYLGMKALYQTIFVALYGATLGKMMLKIRVVAVETVESPHWGASFNRAIFRLLSEIILYLGFIWAMFDPYNQAWHDRTARTIVIDA